MISEEGENTMAKTKVICFTNNKGGSGKTTTCSNVGFGLRELGKKVLMIDGDMQLNLSLSLFDEDTVEKRIEENQHQVSAVHRSEYNHKPLIRGSSSILFSKYTLSAIL